MPEKGKLNEKDFKRLRDNSLYLVEQIEPLNLLDYLFEKDVIDLNDQESIRSKVTRKERAQELLKFIFHSGPGQSFNLFLQALKQTGYTHVFEKLQDSEQLDTPTALPMADSSLCENLFAFHGDGINAPTNWTKLDYLGSGRFGTVYRANYNKGSAEFECAVKEIRGGSPRDITKHEASVRNETKTLGKLCHEKIIKYYGFCSTIQMFFIFLEYMKGGSLENFIGDKYDKGEKIEEPYAGKIVKQVLEAVAYLHSLNHFHRDIKSANVLMLDEWNVKLADFGLTKEFAEITKTYTSCVGTYRFMAPEMFDRKRKYNKPVDIWAIGCILVHLLSGKHPFHDVEENQLHKEMDNNPSPAQEILNKVSEKCRRFFKQTLAINEAGRATAETLLQDCFITGAEQPDIEPDADLEEKSVTRKPISLVEPLPFPDARNIHFTHQDNSSKYQSGGDMHFHQVNNIENLSANNINLLKTDAVTNVDTKNTDKVDIGQADNVNIASGTVSVAKAGSVKAKTINIETLDTLIIQ
ncbi:aurora kinase C [Biomphalaria pfeifferi]|uniref:Aurora kinase C n=1 Tax=Biomphalaria pfeifferi TaxID=112525 RepID=A0AAD8FHS2_BIOPF|nr:aurora kinase C [Biomphalaria pfeifferi]